MGRFLDFVADAVSNGSEHTARNAGGFEHRGREIRRRGLAVGAGDADHLQLAARMSEEGIRNERQCEPVVTHL